MNGRLLIPRDERFLCCIFGVQKRMISFVGFSLALAWSSWGAGLAGYLEMTRVVESF